MTEPLGSIVVDELILPITAVRLRGEAVELTAAIRGPIEGRHAWHYTVNGSDGRTVYRSHGQAAVLIPRLPDEGQAAVVTVFCHVAGKTAERVDPWTA